MWEEQAFQIQPLQAKLEDEGFFFLKCLFIHDSFFDYPFFWLILIDRFFVYCVHKLFEHCIFNFTHHISFAHLHCVFVQHIAFYFLNLLIAYKCLDHTIDKWNLILAKSILISNFSLSVGNISIENGGVESK